MSILLAPSSHPHLLRMATAYAIYACLLLPRVVWGQTIPDFDFRSFDGTDRQDKSGRAHSPLIRWAPASQVDMFDEGRPNPRAVTNVVVRMPEEMPVNQRHMKNMLWQWGQFIDHDFALTTQNNGEQANVMIPMDNPDDVLVQGNCPMMSFTRSDIDPDNTSSREQMNVISAFLDASMVYGSDKARADALRTFADGKLKSTLLPEGELLPFNIDGLPNGGGTGSHLFLAGDVRANEQVGLTAIHTLFVREHNRLADRIKAVGYLNADDEMIYQLARKLVMAEVQIITYNEFLPALLGSRAPKLEDYHFQESVNPQLSNEFSTAFFRFGHTMLPRAIFLAPVSPDESTEWIELRRAFFNIRFFTEHPENIDRVLLGLTATEAEEIDCMIVEDVRSFLFSHDGIHTVCLDLAALNIQRGRDHQIPSYNEVRRALGLRVKTSFDQITANTVFQQSLEQVYGSVNKIDPWIGALAEDHLPDASVGELLTVAMAKQFEAFRDGDPFFFQRSDPIFNMPGMERILNLDDVNLGFVILANTRISDIDFTSCFIGQDAGLAPTAQPSDQRTHPPTTSPSIPPIPDPTPPPTPRDVRTLDPVGEPECRQWILSGEKRFSTRKSVS